LLASHVIDDLVLPINCIDQQGRLALSMTAHSKALGCRRLNSIPQFLFVMGGDLQQMFQRAVARASGAVMQPSALRYACRRINILK